MSLDKYSRQLYTIGEDSMKSLSDAKILLLNVGGLGLEIAKNLILLGVGNLYIKDDKKIDPIDLTTNYYINEKDVGFNRLEKCIDKLKKLNNNVSINIFKKEINEETLKGFDVFVCTDNLLMDEIYYNKICRKNNIRFVTCNNIGVIGHVFCDLINFNVKDKNGEEKISGAILKQETKIRKTIFTTIDQHNLTNDDIITFDDNDEEFKINIIDNLNFSVNKKITQQKKYFYEKKQEINLKFEQLIDNMFHPNINHQYNNIGKLCHYFNIVYSIFYETNKRIPKSWDENDAQELCGILSMFSNTIDINIFKKLVYVSQTQLLPMCAIIGGITANEVMKILTHKHMPIKQWLYYDYIELIPEHKQEIDTSINRINDIGFKHIGQELLFGSKFQRKLKETKLFIIGAGAIGCEHLKNASMCGFGSINVTDMDAIETSNLSRQFLFTNDDIGQFKSKIASETIKKLNNDIDIKYFTKKIDETTKNIFNKEFYDNIDCVLLAVDNVNARKFIDEECVLYKKNLIDSGTLGTKCNVQVIIPYKTESYNSSNDPVEKTIPACTIKTFPYLLEHCVEWAREKFEEMFNSKILALRQFNCNSISDLQNQIQILKYIPLNENQYENVAKLYWDEYYNENIKELLNEHPIDSNDEDGNPFWNNKRKMPKFIDNRSKYYKNFIKICCKFLRNIFHDKINKKFLKLIFKKISKKKNLNLNKLNLNKIFKKIEPIVFDKDNDEHIKLITIMSNSRAINYSIPIGTEFNIKKIAGNIVPALITTTSIVSGLVFMELYKIILGKKNINDFRNTFANFATSYIGYIIPIEPEKNIIGKKIITLWDDIVLTNPSFNDIHDYIKKEIGCYNIFSLVYGGKYIYHEHIKNDINKNEKIYNIIGMENDNIKICVSLLDKDINTFNIIIKK